LKKTFEGLNLKCENCSWLSVDVGKDVGMRGLDLHIYADAM